MGEMGKRVLTLRRREARPQRPRMNTECVLSNLKLLKSVVEVASKGGTLRSVWKSQDFNPWGFAPAAESHGLWPWMNAPTFGRDVAPLER